MRTVTSMLSSRVKGEAEPMLSARDHLWPTVGLGRRASDLPRGRSLQRSWKGGAGGRSRGIYTCRPELKRTLLVRGILLSPAPWARGHRGGGRKQKGPWLWPEDLLGQKFCIYERHAAALWAARRDFFKTFHKRILSTHPSQREYLLCVPRTYSFYLL